MAITWKYKIDIVDANVFKEIESERGILFPEELKKFILEANAATPSKYNFMAGNSERVMGAILSFNRDEADTDSAFVALNVISDKNLIPFAIDPFGNYICYNLDEQEIVFWDHESDTVISTGKTLEGFLEELY